MSTSKQTQQQSISLEDAKRIIFLCGEIGVKAYLISKMPRPTHVYDKEYMWCLCPHVVAVGFKADDGVHVDLNLIRTVIKDHFHNLEYRFIRLELDLVLIKKNQNN